ncbi:MAG: amidohydrolase family protein [Candidatus Firestonebacteria bacterium]|nr:amidohydrolase family protein [Candidatus Firestonebacteria bacterium]
MSALELDPRLVNFSWQNKKAAPVTKLIDPHVHFFGKEEDLECLSKVVNQYNVESLNLIFPPDYTGTETKRICGIIGKIGEKVIPYYWLDLATGDTEQIKRAYDNGFWGLKFIAPKYAYDGLEYEPVFDLAEKLGMPCLIHTGVLGGEYRRKHSGMSLMRADMLDTVATRHPDLLMQGAHLGNPDILAALRASLYCPNLMWDASGGCRFILEIEPKLITAGINGKEKVWDSIMWSTDTHRGLFASGMDGGWPNQFEYQLCFWQKILASLPTAPTTAQLDNFFYGNAKRRMEEVKAKRKK